MRSSATCELFCRDRSTVAGTCTRGVDSSEKSGGGQACQLNADLPRLTLPRLIRFSSREAADQHRFPQASRQETPLGRRGNKRVTEAVLSHLASRLARSDSASASSARTAQAEAALRLLNKRAASLVESSQPADADYQTGLGVLNRSVI